MNGPPSNNPAPLEKTLVHLDLSKGLNERDRPETSDPTTMLTRVENMDQNQGGAWLKRAGTASLGGIESGAAYVPSRLLRLREGLGMVDDAANFYQYQESAGRFVARGTVPEFSVSADSVVSSGASVSPVIYSAGSSTLFHFVLHNAGLSTGTSQPTINLSIFDRQSGALVCQYQLSLVGGVNAEVYNTLACFVDNQYLHVTMYANGGSAYGFVIDTQAVWPTPVSITLVPLLASIGGTIMDMEPGVGRSYIATCTSVGVVTVWAMTNAGTATQSVATTAGSSGCRLGFSGTKLWWVGATTMGAMHSTTLAVVIASAAHGGPGATPTQTVCADRNDVVHLVSDSSKTFGSTTITSVSFYKTTASNGTSFLIDTVIDGWKIGSSPFEAIVGGVYNVFIQLYKEPTGSGGPTPTVVVPIDGALSGVAQVGPGQYNNVRLAATVEPFLAVRTASNDGFVKVTPVDRSAPTEFGLGVAVQVNARGYGYFVYSLSARNSFACQTFSGSNYLGGGTHCLYGGGDQCVEVGYLDIPSVNTVIGAGGAPSGAYKYVLQYRYTDETGAVTWSRTSQVSSVSPVAQRVTVTMSAPSVSLKDKRSGTGTSRPPRSVVELYRTKAGGTQYYLCASSAASTPAAGLATQVSVLGSNRLFTVSDNMSDLTLATQPLLFRQPGTPNAGLDRYPPPAGNILCQHRDRLFTVDAAGTRVCYSSFFVDGETAWFNPAFSFFVHGGSGRITAMASVDGRLFIFKRDGIFVVDGDGPGEGGVIGNEFSPPQRLASEYGCVDPRSLVVTPDGIMYRSLRGIEQMDRGLRVKWLGERVFVTANNYPVTLSSFVDTYGRVHFVCAQSIAATPALQASVPGVELVYDMTADSWSTYYTSTGLCLKDGVMANLYQKGEVACYAAQAGCNYSSYGTGLDSDGTYVKTVVETGWIRTGQQARQRISDAFLLGKRLANHAIRISAAYDFVDTYTQTFTWQPDVINALGVEQLCLQMVKPQCLAVRLLVEEIAATDQVTYPSGSALGCAILGITFNVAPMAGAPQVSAPAQGYVVSSVPQNLTTELLVVLETELSATITTES